MSGKKYKMVDYTKETDPSHNVVFPSQFARLLIQYQEHPEAKSLAPDGSQCQADTRGLLQRAHVVAGELRYVAKKQIASGKKATISVFWSSKPRSMGERRKLSRLKK